jgi:hypothetical protein
MQNGIKSPMKTRLHMALQQPLPILRLLQLLRAYLDLP